MYKGARDGVGRIIIRLRRCRRRLCFLFLLFLFIAPHLVCLFNLEMIFSFSHFAVNDVHKCLDGVGAASYLQQYIET